jgi:hypothetical protein
MKSRRSFPKALLALLLVASFGMAWMHAASAASSQLYISPATVNTQTDNTFTVSLRITPSTAIDTVDAFVGYNATYLSLQSVDCSGSPLAPFPDAAHGCAASGNPVHFTSAILGGSVSTDSLVATLTFKALAPVTASQLTLTGDSAAAGVSQAPTLVPGRVNITAPRFWRI